MWCTKRRVEPYLDEFKPYNVSAKELKQSEFLENSPVNEICYERLEVNGRGRKYGRNGKQQTGNGKL